MNMNYNNICLQDQKLRIALILISENRLIFVSLLLDHFLGWYIL